ncbi:radical SAM protein [Streptomyces sp. NBC_00669]|uniref:biotin synthase BioB n=1 Tax=unclassified Streptomyces TaxID=2593676 RepID=UPI002E30B810|nr:radical SAM protein [Streptomyces sp. NBC_00669]
MLTRSEVRHALRSVGADQEALFAEASRLRDENFDRAVLLRGVIEITNVCRVNCDYCPMRRDNLGHLDRFVMSPQQILERAEHIRGAGIDIVLLQGGETPSLFPTLREVIPALRRMWDGQVEILLNLGNFSRRQYEELRELGANSYIIKHETSDPVLFEQMRHEKLDARLERIRTLLDLGFKVGTGLISSLPGQSLESVIDDIELVGELGVQMCSVSPFVPAPDTPLMLSPAGDLQLALNVIATLRVCYPGLLIPSVSALEKTSSGGQSLGLAAGANVMTSNFTGDANAERYLIYGKERFVVGLDHVRAVIDSMGLAVRGSAFLPEGAE